MSGGGQELSVPRPPATPRTSERVLKRPEDQDFGELVKRTAEDAAHLVEQEVLLLKRELELKVDRLQATVAIGTVGVVGAVLTLMTATATAVLGLSLVIPGWAAGLIVTAVWAVVSVMAIGWAKNRFDNQTIKPEITGRSVSRDVKAIGNAAGGE